MKRFLLGGMLVGLLVPFVFWAAYFFVGYMFSAETAVFWPSSIILMALEGQHSTSVVFIVWALAIAANVLLYSLLGLVAFGVFRFFWGGLGSENN